MAMHIPMVGTVHMAIRNVPHSQYVHVDSVYIIKVGETIQVRCVDWPHDHEMVYIR